MCSFWIGKGLKYSVKHKHSNTHTHISQLHLSVICITEICILLLCVCVFNGQRIFILEVKCQPHTYIFHCWINHYIMQLCVFDVSRIKRLFHKFASLSIWYYKEMQNRKMYLCFFHGQWIFGSKCETYIFNCSIRIMGNVVSNWPP